MTFQDVDEPVARLLSLVREELVTSFGSLVEAWRALEQAAGGLLDEEHFISALASLNVKAPKRLFKLLLSWAGQRTLVMEAFSINLP